MRERQSSNDVKKVKANRKKTASKTQKSPKKVQRIRRTKHSSKKVKKRKKNHIIFYIFLGILVLIICAVLCFTVFFKIEKIDVSGDSNYSVEDVMDTTQVAMQDNLLKLNSDTMQKQLLDYAKDVDDVVVRKSPPSTLVVNFVEAIPQFNLQKDGSYYVVSQSHRVVEDIGSEASQNDAITVDGIDIDFKIGDYLQDFAVSMPSISEKEEMEEADVLEIETKYEEYEKYENVLEIVDKINTIGMEKISKISFDDNIYIFYDNRINIKLGNIVDVEYKLELCKTVLEKIPVGKSGELDASITGKTYFTEKQ